ncbi:hypothetical protein ACEPPN_017049 [Leptodophora sp. 'Broadleaf-Isolate-01']
MRLDADIFNIVGEHLHCHDTLASLCRVSKPLNRIFTPLLYRSIRVEDCSARVLANIANLHTETHLRHCKELYLGANVNPDNYAHIYAIGIPESRRYGSTDDENDSDEDLTVYYDVETDILKKCIRKMPELEILTCEFRALPRSSPTDDEYRIKNLNYDVQALFPDPDSILNSLATSGTLRELTLTSLDSFTRWPLPPFYSLEKLTLQGISAVSNPLIAGILLSSSSTLTSLSLSGPKMDAPHESQLWNLIQSYSRTRKSHTPHAPLLRLSSLELGVGFLPQQNFDLEISDFSLLTDMSALRCLYIGNYTGHDVYPDTFEESTEDIPSLCGFTNLVHLKANLLTERILAFIEHLHTQSFVPGANPGQLVELEIQDAHWAEPGEEDGKVFKTMGTRNGELFREFPVGVTSTKWKRLSISNVFPPSNDKDHDELQLPSLVKCEDLEYLACCLEGDHLERFRADVLPRMEQLRVLMVKKGPFKNGIPRLEPAGEDARTKVAMAESLFKTSWDAWESRRREGSRLEVLGLGCEVYRYILPAPYEMLEKGIQKVVKLSLDEAREYGAVREVLEGKAWYRL